MVHDEAHLKMEVLHSRLRPFEPIATKFSTAKKNDVWRGPKINEFIDAGQTKNEGD